MGSIKQINESILASLCELDVTQWYLEEMKNSLCGRLFQHVTFSHSQDFELKIDNHSAFLINEKNVNISPEIEKIYVPPLSIACYPEFKINEWRKNMESDAWLRRGVKALLRTVDIQLIKILIESNECLIQEKDYNPDTVIMSATAYKNQFGAAIDILSDIRAYLIPTAGSVPYNFADNLKNAPVDWVVERQHDGKRILVTNLISDDKIIECGAKCLGVFCSRDKVFAYPIPAAKKLKLGVVISDEIGLCVYDTSGYSVLSV